MGGTHSKSQAETRADEVLAAMRNAPSVYEGVLIDALAGEAVLRVVAVLEKVSLDPRQPAKFLALPIQEMITRAYWLITPDAWQRGSE